MVQEPAQNSGDTAPAPVTHGKRRRATEADAEDVCMYTNQEEHTRRKSTPQIVGADVNARPERVAPLL